MIFDGLRNDEIAHEPRPRLRVIAGTTGWRQAWRRSGPLLPIAFGLGLLIGSWLAMLVTVIGGR